MISRTYRPDIQFIRGLSVLAVLFFHAKQSIFPAGYLGVDVFFVISGFVVTPLILRIFSPEPSIGVRHNWFSFFKRRFFRLVPALGVCLSFTALAIFLLCSPLDFFKLAQQGFATLLLVGNFGAYSFSGNYFLPHPNPLVHTWSLSVEEQFYLLLPIVIYFFVRGRKNIANRARNVLLGISAISFISFLFPTISSSALNHFGLFIRSDFAFYSPLPRLWEFCLGGIVYFLSKGAHLHFSNLGLIRKLLAPLLLIALLLSPIEIGLRSGPILACTLAAISISTAGFDAFGLQIKKIFIWLGDRSYSIYLVHMPILFVAKYSPIGNFGINRALPTLAATILSIVLGHLSYTRIEERYRYRNTERSSNQSLRKVSILFLLLPALLFGSLAAVSRYHPLNIGALPINGEWGAYPDHDCKKRDNRGLPCIYGNDSSKKTVLLVGDSHAQMLGQALKQSAEQSGWNVVLWGESACSFELGDVKKAPADDCERKNRERFDWIRLHKPDAVIVSMYILREESIESHKSTLRALKRLVPQTLIVNTDPIFPDNNEFVNVRPILMQKYNAPKSLSRKQMLNGDGLVNAQYAKWATANGFTVLDPTKFFCDSSKCWRYDNGEWLYIDDDHLSVAGAKLLIPSFNKYLESFPSKN